ncbi:MAG: hypothetical protein LBU61_04875 [Coriobacteriales bacterium]|jgi:hypothetical protein|nr:hypothetical protein [Coriobacteriales bacterium]
MTVQDQFNYRKQIFDDAIRWRKPDRVPHISNFALWPILDYGVPLSQACRDWDLMERVMRRFIETYKFDSPGFLVGLLGNPRKMNDTIGQGYNVIDDAAGTVLIDDMDLLRAEDYDALITDFPSLMWSTLLPRKYPRWSEVKIADMKLAIDEFVRYQSYMERIKKACVEEYGLPLIASQYNLTGFELLFNIFRGMKGLAYDMRRIPDKLLEAVEKLDFANGALDKLFDDSLANEASAFGFNTVILGHNMLSLTQWECYEWPYLKHVIDRAVAADSTVYIFAEGVISRFYEYFTDVPKGHLAIQLEQDDVFDFRKNLPNVAVSGGMTTRLLGSGTAKQCRDYAKHLIDELGTDGGFILCQDKMMSYIRDASPENLKAVCDFAADYRP